MKLASLKHGRDGRLIVVSRDMTRAIHADEIAATLQQALDNWDAASVGLLKLYDQINAEPIRNSFSFDPADCTSPLPRAYQWADGSAYVNHVELVRKARGAELPASFWTEPLIYQGGSDAFLGPLDAIKLPDPEWGCDFEAEVAVITGDVAAGASEQQAEEAIRLLMLVNDVSLRSLIPAELSKGFGFYQSKPASAFSPIAVTPDELGSHWHDGRLWLPLLSRLNNRLFGQPNAGIDMTFSFPQLLTHAAKTRELVAGSIVGSGTVSNRGSDGGPGKAIESGGLGYSCIAELRMIETITKGTPTTPFMVAGNNIRIEMLDSEGQSIFGAIDQTVVAA